MFNFSLFRIIFFIFLLFFITSIQNSVAFRESGAKLCHEFEIIFLPFSNSSVVNCADPTGITVEPRVNELPRDQGNWFLLYRGQSSYRKPRYNECVEKTSVCYIEEKLIIVLQRSYVAPTMPCHFRI